MCRMFRNNVKHKGGEMTEVKNVAEEFVIVARILVRALIKNKPHNIFVEDVIKTLFGLYAQASVVVRPKLWRIVVLEMTDPVSRGFQKANISYHSRLVHVLGFLTRKFLCVDYSARKKQNGLDKK